MNLFPLPFRFFLFAVWMCIAGFGFSQTPEQQSFLRDFSRQSTLDYQLRRAQAERLADSLGYVIREEIGHTIIELQDVVDGIPVYYTTHNLEGAQVIHSSDVWSGGMLGFDLSGAGQTLGMWDGGATLLSHQEFEGRAVQADDAITVSDHATHVAATMVAGGVNSAAKGMSYQAHLDAYDWNNDQAQMAAAAANGLRVSQHSYGYVTGWRFSDGDWYWYGDPNVSTTKDYRFGFYNQMARDWDLIANNAPYYLIVKSAGNDRGSGPLPGTGHYVNPGSGWEWSTEVRQLDGGEDGYDCISTNGNAKNIMTVGAVTASGEMSWFSGWGPTDDGRIKPDIVAKGVNVYSATFHDDASYGYKNGTSMSGPMVSGSIGLLLEHHQNLQGAGQPMRSETMKALILHTASAMDDHPGPDYRNGWGMMNTGEAAELMHYNALNGSEFNIRELTLNQDQTIEIEVVSDGSSPLKATIAWNDPAGTPPPASLNPTTPMLVNDLDMRISDTQDHVWEPWILDPANPAHAATTGDNFRDNVEQVYVQDPVAGQTYTITISHKGTLTDASQDFSLIASGILAGNVLNPLVFNVSAVSQDQIDLTWEKNTENQPVILAWSENNIWGVPEDGTVYQTGDQIPGGGQILYQGDDLSFSHTGLLANTTYYYRIFSHCDEHEYSQGRNASATTLSEPVSIPFTDHFDYQAGSLPEEWQQTGDAAHNWIVEVSSFAGGSSPELSLNWDPSDTGMSRVVSYPILVDGYSNLTLSLKQYLDNFSINDNEVAAIDLSFDEGETWQALWETIVEQDIPQDIYEFPIAVPQDATLMRIGFRFQGNSYNINDWFIDNLSVFANEADHEVFAYWNFNENLPPSNTNWDQPIASQIGNAFINYTFTEAYSFVGTDLNGSEDEVAGGSFAPRGGSGLINNGRHFTLYIPTDHKKDVVLSYAIRRTTTGFATQQIQYTVDGETWIDKEIIDISDFENDWLESQIVQVSFEGFTATYHNPDFAVRIILNGATGNAGNNRFDNIVVTASDYQGADPGSGEITLEGQLHPFGKVYTGHTSDVQFYDVSGSDLTTALVIESEHPGFLLSLNCEDNFTQSIELMPVEGVVAPTRIFVRFNPLVQGTINSHLVHATEGVADEYLAMSGQAISSQIPEDYYSTATGTGETLLGQLHQIIRGHEQVTYASIWSHFAVTDPKFNGKVWDIYSDVQCAEPPYEFVFFDDQQGADPVPDQEGVVYNREHSWPRSWWGGSTTDTMFTDIHHIYPTDRWVNSQRSNYPFGIVASPSWVSENGGKLGGNVFGGFGGTVFEPVDAYKGDLARTYFYMVARYQSRLNQWAQNNQVEYILDGSAYPAFEPWFLEMLLQWHEQDPVSQKEINRNNAIYAIQGNRNPFVDHPEWVEMIWGEQSYMLTLEADPLGSATLSGEGEYLQGHQVSVQALPDEGFRFLDWQNQLGAVISEVPEFLFTMPSQSALLTARLGQEGDANRDGVVNVQDVALIVNDILDHHNEVFYPILADVNQDGVINVLDIVGVVNIIMNHKRNMPLNTDFSEGTVWIDNGLLQIQSTGNITAMEFEFRIENGLEPELTLLSSSHSLSYTHEDGVVKGVIFSISNSTFPEGIFDLLHTNLNEAHVQWHYVYGSDYSAQTVEIIVKNTTFADQPTGVGQELKLYPNPAPGLFTLKSHDPVKHIEVLDVNGKVFYASDSDSQRLRINLKHAPEGIYFVRVTTENQVIVRKVQIMF